MTKKSRKFSDFFSFLYTKTYAQKTNDDNMDQWVVPSSVDLSDLNFDATMSQTNLGV